MSPFTKDAALGLALHEMAMRPLTRGFAVPLYDGSSPTAVRPEKTEEEPAPVATTKPSADEKSRAEIAADRAAIDADAATQQMQIAAFERTLAAFSRKTGK